MKSVVSRVMDGINETEFGESIDIIFGKTSIIERKVNSPPVIATTTLVLDVLSKHIYSLYKGETNAKAK